MLKYKLIFVLFIISLVGVSQEVDSLSVLFDEEEVLSCDDAINVESENYKEALRLGVVFFDFQMSECEKSRDFMDYRNRISRVDKSADTIMFTIEFKKNCCGGALMSVNIVDSLTWNFEVIKVDEACGECFCTCCFTTQIRVKNNSGYEPKHFLFNGENLTVSDTLVLAVFEQKVFWDNGNLKFFEQYYYDVLRYRIYLST